MMTWNAECMELAEVAPVDWIVNGAEAKLQTQSCTPVGCTGQNARWPASREPSRLSTLT